MLYFLYFPMDNLFLEVVNFLQEFLVKVSSRPKVRSFYLFLRIIWIEK